MFNKEIFAIGLISLHKVMIQLLYFIGVSYVIVYLTEESKIFYPLNKSSSESISSNFKKRIH